MIGSLRGRVIDRRPSGDKGMSEVLLEVNDVGYRVTVGGATLASLGSEQALLAIHHHYWEADQRLFGFATNDERDAFEGLLGAHKVGPALAMAIICAYPPAELSLVLANDDIDALCQVPGVGKKTAQRLLVDLKSVLVLPVADGAQSQAIDLTQGAAAPDVLADVREALANLGYSSDEIKLGMSGLGSADADGDLEIDAADAGALLKQALRTLAGA